jgi:hypothetical protein
MTWRHAAGALIVGGLFALTNARFLGAYGLFGPPGAAFALRHLIVGCFMMLAICAANRLVDHGAPRLQTYTAAVAIVALLCDPIALYLSDALQWGVADMLSRPLGMRVAWRLSGAVGVMIKGGLGTAAYVRLREARVTSEALRRSQLQRARDARRLVETRMQTLQARIDPLFLFDALKQVAALQQNDPVAADVLLDELIALLRALMPQEPADASTVVREFAMAASYLRIAAAARGPLTVDISIAGGTGEARLPPMLLVPLLRAVLAAARTDVALLLRLRADSSTSRVRIQLDLTPAVHPSFLASEDLDHLRTQLSELYGEEAALSVQAQGAPTALLELPHEAAWRPEAGALL